MKGLLAFGATLLMAAAVLVGAAATNAHAVGNVVCDPELCGGGGGGACKTTYTSTATNGVLTLASQIDWCYDGVNVTFAGLTVTHTGDYTGDYGTYVWQGFSGDSGYCCVGQTSWHEHMKGVWLQFGTNYYCAVNDVTLNGDGSYSTSPGNSC
jgi:hypothetical protein